MLAAVSRRFVHRHMPLKNAKRELTNEDDLMHILDSCQYASLSLIDPMGKPYVVPMSFGYQWGKEPILFFHGAKAGRKIDCIRKNPFACVSFVKSGQLIPAIGSELCSTSMLYESMIAEGPIEIVTNPEEKRIGMAVIMSHYRQPTGPFPPGALDRVNIFKMVATDLCGKFHLPRPN